MIDPTGRDLAFLIPLAVLSLTLLVVGAVLILGDPARIARRDQARADAMRRHPSNPFRPTPDPIRANLDRSLDR